ncbi:MAG: protein kinase [Planctomycetales bacterium]|nr:protein kinase [Planctomycetales bacterium]
MPEHLCPSSEDLLHFSNGDLSAKLADRVAEHLDQCPACLEAIQSMETQAGLRVDDTRGFKFSGEEAFQQVEPLVCELVPSPHPKRANPSARSTTSDELLEMGELGQYRLLEKLAEGGMGAVYKAKHTRLEKLVALKVVPQWRIREPQALARFQAEMRAVGRLEHPNIVRAMDAGEIDGTHFLVMEYVRGADLSKLITLHGPLPIPDACELIRQAAVGLADAHSHGIVHRDIKPSNLMLAVQPNGDPIVKVLDLGLAMLPNDTGITSTGQVMGTIDFMAPEQGGDSKGVDIRADIYSLGATLYWLLTGNVVYCGEQHSSPMQKMVALATQPAPSVQSRRAGVPEALAEIIHRMLQKKPECRFQTPQDVADALHQFCAGANLALLLPPSTNTADAADPSTAPSVFRGAAADAKLDNASGPDAIAASSEDTITPSIRVAPAVKPQAGPDSRARHPLAVGLSLLVIVAFFAAATVFFFQTPEGTLRVEINAPDIEVRVKGEDIVLTNTEQGTIKLTPKDHALIVSRGEDFQFVTKQFSLTSGRTRTVRVDLLPDMVQVASEGKTLGQFPIAQRSGSNADRLESLGADRRLCDRLIQARRTGAVNYIAITGVAPETGARFRVDVHLKPEQLNNLPERLQIQTLAITLPGPLKQEWLADISHLQSLESLQLHATLDDQTVVDLLRDPPSSLRTLRLDGLEGTLGPAGATAIRKAGNLEHLELRWPYFKSGMLAALGSLDNCRQLTLGGFLRDSLLLELQPMPRLEIVQLAAYSENNPLSELTERGLTALSRAPKLHELELLTITITRDVTDQLAKLPLQKLTLHGSQAQLDRDFLAPLAQLDALQSLSLTCHKGLTDDHLLRLPELASLTSLTITGAAQMSDASLKVIANLKQLRELRLEYHKLSRAAFDELLAQLPKLRAYTAHGVLGPLEAP